MLNPRYIPPVCTDHEPEMDYLLQHQLMHNLDTGNMQVCKLRFTNLSCSSITAETDVPTWAEMHPPSPHWWSMPAPDVFRIRSHNHQDIHYISMPNRVPRSTALYAQPHRLSKLDLDRDMIWLDATCLSLRRVTAIADHFLDRLLELV